MPGGHIGCPGQSETARLMDNLVADTPSQVLSRPARHLVYLTVITGHRKNSLTELPANKYQQEDLAPHCGQDVT